MQDKLIEAAQEVEGPFIVESEGRGCDKCGAGEFWNVVFKPEDVALSTAYGDKEEAEDLAEDLNNAFRKGVSSVRAHDAGTVSTAQLDAEDQHRASEQVTGEPTAWSAQDHTEEYVQQGYITEPVEDVPSGYVKLEDVEKALTEEWGPWHPALPDVLQRFRAHLAPKPEPSLQDEIAAVLKSHEYKVTSHTALAAELAALAERRAGK